MKIGDECEVLYGGEWVGGKIQSAQNVEADLKQAQVKLYTVTTGKGMVMGVAVEHGNMRVKESK